MKKIRDRALRLALNDMPKANPLRMLTLGVAGDGGLMVFPPSIEVSGWHYGKAEGNTVTERAFTELAPKLHWHRSGYVSATVQGSHPDFKKINRVLQPLDRVGSQKLWITVVRPLEALTERERSLRDVFQYVPNAPGLSLGSIRMEIRLATPSSVRHAYPVADRPLAMDRADLSSIFASLEAYGTSHGVKVSIDAGPETYGLPPGFAVVATDDETPSLMYALWSDGMRPAIAMEGRPDLKRPWLNPKPFPPTRFG